MRIIKKLFIKDYQNTDKMEVRNKYGVVAGVLGIISNVILFVIKIVIGLIAGSITIIADAVNNLTDAGSSVITLVGFKLSSRPADKEHRYGHQRYEYIAGFIIAIIIILVGILLGKSSIDKILSPTKISINYLTYIILSIAILIKVWQMFLYRGFSKSIDSYTLKASSIDSRNDIITTFFVLIAAIIMDVTSINLDGYFGIALSVFIAISGFKLLKETIDPLIGGKLDKEIARKIEDIIMSYDGVLGVHDLMLHIYGKNICFAVIDVEIPSTMDIMECHHLMDTIERDVKARLDVHLTIHMDPVEQDDSYSQSLENVVINALNNLNPNLSMHDFRALKRSGGAKIYFDVEVPFEIEISLEQIRIEVENALREFSPDDKFKITIDIDRH